MAFRPEDLLLWGGTLSAFAAALAALFHVRGQGFDHYARAQRLAVAAAAFFALGLALLLVYFIDANAHVQYVYDHTDQATPLVYRIAGLWAGHQGTFLLWTASAAAVLALNGRLWQRRVDAGATAPPDAAHPLPWLLLFGMATVAFLGATTALDHPFQRTEPWQLGLDPDGHGLRPGLRTPFMVLQPALQFLTYGLIVLPFAAALAHLASGRREWADIALPWTRLTLLLAWTSLGIGALWAYYGLNRGGYWSWEPVETANLLVVLLLIPLIHGLIYYRKKGMFSIVAPLFAVLAFLSTLLSALATERGVRVSFQASIDPSQAYDRDALRRLLDILDSSPFLRHVTTIFLAAAFAALLVYFWRRQRATAPNSPMGMAYTATFFALGSAFALAFIDPTIVLGLVFEGARLIRPARPELGLAILVALLVLLGILAALVSRTRAWLRRPGLSSEIFTMANLVWAGMIIVALGALAVFLVDVTSVNAYDRRLYDDRASWIALPLLLVLGVALMNKTVGTPYSLALAVASLAVGGAFVLMRGDPWQVLLGFPVFLFALAGALVKLFKVSDAGPTTPLRLRIAGATLLFGGVAALAYWANPPTRIPLGIAILEPDPWWVLWGYPLGLLSMFGGVAVLRRRNHRLALVGAAALALTAAWTIAIPMGLAAFLLILRARSHFAEGLDAWDLASTMRGLERDVRKTGVYLIHVGLVLGLGGYATSVFLESEEVPLRLDEATGATAHGYGFRLLSSTTEGVDPEGQLIENVHADVIIFLSETVLATLPLTLWQELPAHYAERATVGRFASEDLYLRPTRLDVEGPATPPSFAPHEDDVFLRPGTRVTAVEFTAKTLPGMHLVWGGVWMISTGILVSLAFGGWRVDPASRPSREPPR